MMIDLAERLRALGFEPGVDFNARDDSDGRGPYIAEWMSDQPQPSATELEAVTPPSLPEITYKADVWRRCTEDEAEALDSAMQTADAKLRGIWNASSYIDHSDDMFTTLRDFTKAALGASDYTRADELLAASE